MFKKLSKRAYLAIGGALGIILTTVTGNLISTYVDDSLGKENSQLARIEKVNREEVQLLKKFSEEGISIKNELKSGEGLTKLEKRLLNLHEEIIKKSLKIVDNSEEAINLAKSYAAGNENAAAFGEKCKAIGGIVEFGTYHGAAVHKDDGIKNGMKVTLAINDSIYVDKDPLFNITQDIEGENIRITYTGYNSETRKYCFKAVSLH